MTDEEHIAAIRAAEGDRTCAEAGDVLWLCDLADRLMRATRILEAKDEADEAEIRRLREALRPFADMARRECVGFVDIGTMPSFAHAMTTVNPDDVRRAAEVLRRGE